MATFLNTVLNNVLLSLETEYNVYEVYDADDANVILNDVQEASFPVAFFSIKNNGAITLTRHKKSYPVYDVAIWLLNLYEEDNKSELETNYEGLRLDALEFLQRFQRTTAFSRVPTNTVLTPRVEEFDAQLDLLATAVQITFTASIDIEEDTSRVCAPLSISSFILNDSNLDAVVLNASASSYRGTASGSTAGTHNWVFVMNGTIVSISGLATSTLSASDIASLATIGMINASGTYNSFTFEKNPNKTEALNFVISVSHTYDFRSNGEASPATTDVISKRILFIFNTTWNTSTDGAFNPSITGGVTTWVFGTDTVIGTSPNYSGTFLQGVGTKTVIVTNTDFDSVTSFAFQLDKIVGNVDLSFVGGVAKNIQFADNTGLVSITTGDFELTGFGTNCNSTSALETVDLGFSTVNGGALSISNVTSQLVNLTLPTGTTSSLLLNNTRLVSFDSTNLLFTGIITISSLFLTSAVFDSAPQTITSLGFFGLSADLNGTQFTLNGALTYRGTGTIRLGGGNLTSIFGFNNVTAIELGDSVISSITTSVNLSGNNMSTAEVDAVWVELDRVAIATGIARTLNVGGNNDAPSATSLTARNSLISKGYTLVI